MKKIIYISGLGHSGSTLLDMVLGVNEKAIGLGEIMPFLRRKDHIVDLKSTCSCGKLGYDCEFWQNAEKVIENSKDETEAYIKLAEYFFEKYGNDTILIDSSKNSYKYLEEINKKYDLKVIYLTRDYRSWVFSRFVNNGGLPIIWAYRWFFENLKIINQLKKMNVSTINVGYEELSLYPDNVLPKLCKKLDIEYNDKMLYPNLTKSHIINGNLLRADAEKKQSIKYDGRWLTSFQINFLPVLFPFVKLNKVRVYSNVLGKSMKSDDFLLFGSKRRKELNKKFN